MLLERFSTALTTDDPDCIEKFNRDESPLLVAHPASLGAGVNLQKGSANTVIWTSPTWSSEARTQGNGRLHRQGQTNSVSIVDIVANDTLDDFILEAVEEKVNVERALLDYVELW